MTKVLQYISLKGLWLRTSFWNEGVPYYLGNFDINYIILRNVEIFKKYFFQIAKYSEWKYWIFRNIIFHQKNI
jgi:hypothetical protein